MIILNCRNYIECIKETERIHMIGVDRLKITKENRKESENSLFYLAQSIRRYGFIQPICIKKHYFDNCFDVVSGVRRLRAAKLLKMRKVPCIITEAQNETASEMSLIENLAREELGLFEEADAIAKLKEEYSLTQEEIAKDLCVSQSYISNRIRLLKFSKTERAMIIENKLTERHCRALLRISDKCERGKILMNIVGQKMDISASEKYIEDYLYNGEEVKVPCYLRDMTVFYNTIENAVKKAKELGVKINKKESENEKEKRIEITVKKE